MRCKSMLYNSVLGYNIDTLAKEMQNMDILQKHTSQYFGTVRTISRSGKTIYTARGVANSDLGLYANGRQVQRTTNYSAQRKAGMTLLQRVIER